MAGRPDEVRAVGVKALLYQQIYLPEIHEPEVDRDLLRLTHAADLLLVLGFNIHIPSEWMVDDEVCLHKSVFRWESSYGSEGWWALP
jgi:hypothetical protein